MYQAFEMIKMEARRYGVNVVGSEVIGTVPMKALLMAAEYYLQIENFNLDEILENGCWNWKNKSRSTEEEIRC